MNQPEFTVFPRFYIEAVQHSAKSEAAGRPIFEDREYVEIRIAGDNKSVVVRKVSEEDKQRWPTAYAAFKNGLEAPVEGTPLHHWPALSVSQVAELRALNINTVEALAALSDTGISKIGFNGRVMVAKAKAFLDTAKGTADAQKMAAENEALRADIEMLKEQIKALGNLPKGEAKPVEQPAPQPVQQDQPAAPDSVAIESLGLSSRTTNALVKAGITDTDKLLALTPDALLEIPGIGQGALDEIGEAFKDKAA